VLARYERVSWWRWAMKPGFGHGVRGVANDAGHALHARLMRGDPTAPSDLVDCYLPPLVNWLLRAFPRRDGALLETVATVLILDGERRTEPYAALFGLQDRPREEQAPEVKRAKDRLKKKLQRLWRRQDDDA